MSSFVAALRSPLALFSLPKASWRYLWLYLGLAAGLMVGLALALDASKAGLGQWAMGFFFPESWHPVVEILVGSFYGEETRLLFVNLVIQASLQLVTLTLFPVKEMLSSSYEREAALVSRRQREHPLWKQGLQELQYFLLFLGVYGALFLIAREGGAWTIVAALFSYAWLFFTYAVDFIAPLFQRHEGHYSQIYKTLALRLPASLAFGAIFAAPSLIAGALWAAHPEWNLPVALAVVFAANVVGVAWAAVSGTYLAAQLFELFERRERSHGLLRWGGTVVLAMALGSVGYFYWGIGKVLLHKTQVLKCHYRVDLDSVRVRRPTLLAVVSKRAELRVGMDVEIENPTEFDVSLENNRITFVHDGEEVGDAQIDPLIVEAGERELVPVELTIGARESILSQGRQLLSTEGWRITLHLEVVPGYEFPIELL